MNKNTAPFSVKKRIESFRYAINGIKILLKEEHNARIHLLGAILTTCAGFFFNISALEWISVTLCIGAVMTLEIINSAIENLCDFVSPEKNELIGKAKDLGAAAVLITAISALIVGLIIFIPKIINLCSAIY